MVIGSHPSKTNQNESTFRDGENLKLATRMAMETPCVGMSQDFV
jgi:hypothetical protein